ncbi:flagellar FlbD family protein [Caldibacillus lycopersici]|uniref:Flagellar FlbD family protein n=1 Tax=Perspicuibacillus lycopersici TaxID=1325689 RepID=A0AAE3IPK9_9BACI|nr:flagellar FlbD family protein [Perspicuibacillus lycopersici]MCU9612097.1 flagellar FlbD family protein [Perspicuibacillus lycopersici]
MIKLTKLNGKTFYINAIYIESVESFPDTTIILTNGKKYVVKEEEKAVIELTKSFYRDVQIISNPGLKEDDLNE